MFIKIVWHTGFKCKVKYCYEEKPCKGQWYRELIESGGYMETQLIEKYHGQDKNREQAK